MACDKATMAAPSKAFKTLCTPKVATSTIPTVTSKISKQAAVNYGYLDTELGAVDYVFGDAAAWFGECKFLVSFQSRVVLTLTITVPKGTIASSRGGYVTASSRTFDNDTAWYVVDHSTVRSLTF
jgi:hypothetical protein